MTTAREKHIQYAQLRRDNENEAREELERRLPPSAIADLKSRGDLTKPAKVMGAALLYFAPGTEISKPLSRRSFGEGRSREYAKLRRDNEVEARDALAAVIPKDLHELCGERTDFNQTTKVIIAAAKYFDLLNAAAAAAATVTAAKTEAKAKGEREREGKGGRGGVVYEGERRGAGYRYMKLNPDASVEESDGEQQQQRLTAAVSTRATQSFARTEAAQKRISTSALQTSQTSSSPTPPPHSSNFTSAMELAGARKPSKPTTPTKTAPPSSRGTKRAREEGEEKWADVLADLRRDEREQEGVVLDVKPPSRTRSGGPKTVHPLMESTKKSKKARIASPPAAEIDPTAIPELQALQTTATRLVKKAEEMAVANGGVDGELKTIVADAHDFMVDLISVLEQGGEKQREMRKKWDAKKKGWEEGGVDFQEG